MTKTERIGVAFDVLMATAFGVMMASAFAVSEPSPHQEFYMTMMIVAIVTIAIVLPGSIVLEELGWM